MGIVAVKDETRGKRPPKRSQLVERGLPSPVSPDLERPRIGNPNLDLVAFLQLERLDDSGWKANSQAVAPLRDLHARTSVIYKLKCISSDSCPDVAAHLRSRDATRLSASICRSHAETETEKE